MTYVITSRCIDVKDGACTVACPVDCIYEGGRMFYIQPDECIDCGLCLSICPVDAIVDRVDAGLHDEPFVAVNREYFSPAISGLGSPGGWDAQTMRAVDHPTVAAWPAISGQGIGGAR